jgi:regulatory protein
MKRKTSLKERALRYLSVREHSKRELAGKLLRFVQEDDDLNALLDWLEKEGFLSDERFAQSLVRCRVDQYGNSRIRQELRHHQVEESLPDSVMRELLQNENARARAVWEKKFGKTPADGREYARQARFLQQRGFSADAIRKAMASEKN